jgi:hypothetical protein
MSQSVATVQVIMDWITSLGWNATQELGYPLYPGPLILDEPDQSVWITPTGGPGYITEEPSADAWSFQAMTRGPSDDPFTPDSVARLLDQMILAAPFPASADGVNIQHVHRLGGPPAALPVDPGDLRHTFTCNYIMIAGV